MDESRGSGSLNGQRKGSPRFSSKHSTPSSQGQKPAKAEEGVAEVPTQNVPCGACKFLRRKCVNGCICAPYFSTDQGVAKFAAVHKVFGASNVSKLLLHVTVTRRHDATVTICYQAQARLADPVYGCISTILVLQQQVAYVRAELALVHSQLMSNHYTIPNPLPSSDQQQQLHLSYHTTNIPTTLRPAFFNSFATSNIINIINFPTCFDIASATSSSPNLEPLRFSPREEEEDDDEESIPAAFATGFNSNKRKQSPCKHEVPPDFFFHHARIADSNYSLW